MSATAEPPASWPTWPLILRPDDLAEITRVLRVVADPLSPLYGLLHDAHPEGPGRTGLAGEVHDHVLAPDAAVALDGLAGTLWTLAAPRQLLIVQSAGAGADPLAFYLFDGLRIVRFVLSEEDCLTSGWQSPEVFGASLSAWLQAPEDSTGGLDRVADRFLRGLAGLLDAGLRTPGGAPLSVTAAQEAVAAALDHRANAEVALKALEADGVVTIGDDGVRMSKDWAERFAYLLEEPSLVVHAIELADARRGVWRPTVLSVLGQTSRRVCVIPPHGHEPLSDVLLNLPPLTAGALGEALDWTLAPPAAPPTTPSADYAGSPVAWLSELDPATSVSLPAFHDAFVEQLLDDDDAGGDAARIMLDPAATVEVLEACAGRADADTTVFALTAAGAVEWRTVGSTTRWRALDVDQVGSRLRALLPDAPSAQATGTAVHLDAEQAVRLMSGRLDETLLLSGEIGAAAADPNARWHAVRARYRSGTTIAGVVLLALASPEYGLWRLEPEADGFVAQVSAAAELRDELVAALS
jgi:hypothetical protein